MEGLIFSEDPFDSEQSQELFEVIDKLHSCGAKAYVDLPEVYCWLVMIFKEGRADFLRLLLLAISPQGNPLFSKA